MRSWRLIIIFAICYALSFSLLGYERMRVRMTASEVRCMEYALETSAKAALKTLAATIYEEEPVTMAEEVFDTVFENLTKDCGISFKNITLTFYLNGKANPTALELSQAEPDDEVTVSALLEGGTLEIPGSKLNIEREVVLSVFLDEKDSIK